MIYEWLCRQSHAISAGSLPVPPYQNQWRETQDERRRQWLEMLGLWPLPERTPMEPTITGTLERDGYVVEKLHFQAVPGCYTTANLYRPPEVTEPLPCVIYHCGHGGLGKATAHYQAQGPYWARHGYVAIILDTIEIGEGQGDHHGIYRGGRWDWLSRGYTPSGTETWIGMRALDYLATREDCDAERVGITGISGGGAISWWQGAADERVKIVAPVCQTGSVEMLVADRILDGHCDCAVWNNWYQFCWPDIGALICPRPLLVCNGTDDGIWRPYAFRESVHRIKQLYEMLGIGDRCMLLDEIVPHSYTPTSRKTIMRWFNRHLKGDDTPVTDDITDYQEPEENLLVFPGERPPDDMPRVWEVLVPVAQPPEVTDEAAWREHQGQALGRLCSLSLRNIPRERCPELVHVRTRGGSDTYRATEYEYDGGD
ncbi:MAG TPA: alpha/beta hydrolase family protein, partial [Armatimonadota bacterium]|nr:alpha/beta hydrolase family protein [Armatimonadota bacterium]